MLDIEVVDYFSGNWIMEIKSNERSLIDVLKDKELCHRVTPECIQKQIESDCQMAIEKKKSSCRRSLTNRRG